MTDFQSGDVVAFKHPDVDTVYISIANYLSVNRRVNISLNNRGVSKSMLGVKATRTDATSNSEEVLDEVFDSPLIEYEFITTPYSLSTLKIGIESTITSIDADLFNEPLIRFSNDKLTIESETVIDQIAAYTLSGQEIFSSDQLKSKTYSTSQLNQHIGLIVLKIQTSGHQFTKKIYLNE